jgi:hypothetical protein
MAYCSDDAPFPYVWPKRKASSGKGHYLTLTDFKKDAPVFESKMDQSIFKSSDGLKKLVSLTGITFFACEDSSTTIPGAAAAAPAAAQPSMNMPSYQNAG